MIEGFEVDAVWPQQKVIVELDGYVVRRTREAFERDRVRDTVLQLAGFRVLRGTSRRLDDHAQAVEFDLQRALR